MSPEQAPDPKILSADNAGVAKRYFRDAVELGTDFKLQDDVRAENHADLVLDDYLEPVPEDGKPIDEILEEFKKDYLPYCSNFASPNFMGFPDAGNSVAAITGNIVADFLQQNLINQTFCSPSGTFAEINVIRWLRSVVGYEEVEKVDSIFDVGGVITGGGTTSNAIGIMLARENYAPDTMRNGVDGEGYNLVVPRGIGHYSVKSAQMWLGCGNRLIEVETDNYRYDLNDLEEKLKENKGKIMGLVAYAGDSRTMTVDRMADVAKLTREIDDSIWLHADACHGFSLGFSDKLRGKLDGIEQFDSITTDPHKVMNSPYTVSALLVKDPAVMKVVCSMSDLIMQEQNAFGQITPFIGSKPWSSLKLWFALKNIGRKGFGDIIDDRHQIAQDFADMLDDSDEFTRLNDVEINSVAFMYDGGNDLNLDELNALNKALHTRIIEEGRYHLHQFSIPDDGKIEKGAMLHPLRFMSGNPNLTREHLTDLLEYLRYTGAEIRSES